MKGIIELVRNEWDEERKEKMKEMKEKFEKIK